MSSAPSTPLGQEAGGALLVQSSKKENVYVNKVQCTDKKVSFADASGRRAWIETVSSEANSDTCVFKVIEKLLSNMPRKADPQERLGALAAIGSVLARRRLVLSADLMTKFLAVVTEDPHELIFDTARPLFKAAATNGHRVESLGIVSMLRKETVATYRSLGGNPALRQLEQQLAQLREELKTVQRRMGVARFRRCAVNLHDTRECGRLQQEVASVESQVSTLLLIERKAYRLESLSRL